MTRFHNACLMYMYHCTQHNRSGLVLLLLSFATCTALYHYTLIIVSPAEGLHFSALVVYIIIAL